MNNWREVLYYPISPTDLIEEPVQPVPQHVMRREYDMKYRDGSQVFWLAGYFRVIFRKLVGLVLKFDNAHCVTLRNTTKRKGGAGGARPLE